MVTYINAQNAKDYHILFNKAEIQKVAIFHSTKVLDEAINASSDATILMMTNLLKSGNMTALIGVVVILMLIIFSFLIVALFSL